jgi:tetratricopeptide (TPR) repeat protein
MDRPVARTAFFRHECFPKAPPFKAESFTFIGNLSINGPTNKNRPVLSPETVPKITKEKGIMKIWRTLLILLMVMIWMGCAGGKGDRKKPDHLTSGMREVKKGIAWHQKGCYYRALEHFFKAHELFSASDQIADVALSLNNIGNVYRATGDIDGALLLYKESADIYTALGDKPGLAQTLSNLAATMIDADRFEEAETVLDQADRVASDFDTAFLPVMKNRGILLARKKAFSKAEEILLQVLDKTDRSNLSEVAAINSAIGHLMINTERHEKAVGYLTAALNADRASGFYGELAADLTALGSVHEHMEEYEKTVDFYKRAVKIYALMENQEKMAAVQARLEALSKEKGIDLSVTEHFVDRWQDGKAYIHPCR